MTRQITHVLIALIVALATVFPTAVRAMPMPVGTAGAAAQHCPSCPKPDGTDINPDKMPACQILACAGSVAMLPAATPLPERALLRAPYLTAMPVLWTMIARAPDPFPPRPIALV